MKNIIKYSQRLI
ncbi:hypothetical protein Tsp_12743, partial [Trichinella spiralis]